MPGQYKLRPSPMRDGGRCCCPWIAVVSPRLYLNLREFYNGSPWLLWIRVTFFKSSSDLTSSSGGR